MKRIRDEKYKAVQVLGKQCLWNKYRFLRYDVTEKIRTAKESYFDTAIYSNRNRLNE